MDKLTFISFGSPQIVLDPLLLTNSHEPARRHRRKRIQKKWLKRYGYKPRINENIYVTQDEQTKVKTIIMHPATFRKFVEAFGSEDEAAKGINKYFTEVTG